MINFYKKALIRPLTKKLRPLKHSSLDIQMPILYLLFAEFTFLTSPKVAIRDAIDF